MVNEEQELQATTKYDGLLFRSFKRKTLWSFPFYSFVQPLVSSLTDRWSAGERDKTGRGRIEAKRNNHRILTRLKGKK